MPPVSEMHVQHDSLLVASLAAGDLAGTERDRANAQISACPDCAALHADLILIARATAALPPAVAPRDFTLTTDQAARLRPTGLRRLVAAIAGSRPLMSRQLGMGLATIGLAGLLVSAVPSMLLGGLSAAAPAQPAAAPAGGASAGSAETATDASGPVSITGDEGSSPPKALGPVVSAASPAASAAVARPIPNPSASGGGGYGTVAGGVRGAASAVPSTPAKNNDAANSTANPQAVAEPLDAESVEREPVSPRTLVFAGSLVFLAAGVALLALRGLVRRTSPN